MGNVKDTNILFFVTSPRTPFKMIPEIRLLVENLKGKPWNKISQEQFAIILAKSKTFYGEAKKDKGFSARDRINRSPKALGFVDLKPKIKLTPAGYLFITSSRPHEIYTRQLLKFQLPSPFHIDKKNNYYIKPYLEILRIIYDLENLSKDEIKMFALQMVDFRMYDDIKEQIIGYRERAKTFDRSQMSYKTFKNNEFNVVIEKIYKDKLNDISSEEKIKTYMTKKKNNMRDYADACFRYLRATELVTVNRQASYLTIPSDKKKEVEFILNTIDRKPSKFVSEREYKAYLYNSLLPVLAIDNIAELKKILVSFGLSEDEISQKSILELQNIKEKLVEKRKAEIIKEEVKELETFSSFNDILELYKNIIKKEVVDQPLMLEWNTWRAFTMLNDGKINGNFKIDSEGMPLNTALGNMPDIECNYKNFDVVVEVTMSSGKRQYEIEGEPVARHLGELKTKEGRAKEREAYCIFIASTINKATLAHFFVLHCSKVKYYGGRSKIIPISLKDFVGMLLCARKNQSKLNSQKLKSYLENLSKKALEAEDEEEWFSYIQETTSNWLSI